MIQRLTKSIPNNCNLELQGVQLGIPNASILRHFAELVGLSEKWCAEAFRLIAVEDMYHVVEDELARLQRLHENKQTKKPVELRDSWDYDHQKDLIETRAHHLLATKLIRPILLESITWENWKAIIDFVKIDLGPKLDKSEDFLKWAKRNDKDCHNQEVCWQWIQKQVGRNIGADFSNIYRWENHKTLPEGDKVLGGILLGLKSDLKEFPFPDRSIQLPNALSRTMGMIKENNVDIKSPKKPLSLPTNEDRQAIRYLLEHEYIDSFVSDGIPIDKESLKKLLTNISLILKEEFPDHPPWTSKRLTFLIDEWAMVYAHCRIALYSGWSDGTEDEWNWGDVEDE